MCQRPCAGHWEGRNESDIFPTLKGYLHGGDSLIDGQNPIGLLQGHECPGAARYPTERKGFLEKAVPVLLSHGE